MTKLVNKSEISKTDIFFAKLAKQEFASWHYAKEHRTGLIIARTAKYLTMAISAGAGYLYLSVMFVAMLSQQLAIFAAVAVLFLLELATAYFISKTVKFTIKKRFTTALPYLVFALLIYSVTFYTSTNGLAERQAKKADQTSYIVTLYSDRKDSIIQVYNNRIDFIKSNPEKFAPDATGKWNARRLSTRQLSQIENFEAQKDLKLKELDQLQNQTMLTNSDDTNTVHSKYYWFVAGIMFVQLVSNVFIMFANSQIYKENNRADLNKEKIENQKNIIQTNTENFMLQVVSEIQNYTLNSLKIPIDYQTTEPKTTGQQNTSVPGQQKNGIGFLKNLTNQQNEPTNTAYIDTENSKTIDSTLNVHTKKHCLYCNKDITNLKHWNAKYCSPEHRVLAYETRTGKTFRVSKPTN